MHSAPSFDPIWDEKYAAGHEQRYPWDMVVSFVFRNFPRDKPRNNVRILEVGCGTASNLWFAAREGFNVAGVDASQHAIERARQRFNEEGLAGDLRISDFKTLPFDDHCFDLVIDRGALTCCGTTDLKRALEEIARCLVEGGRFLFNPYSDAHSSHLSGRPGPDDLTVDISEGSLVGVGQVRFTSRNDIDALLPPSLRLLSIEHLKRTEMLNPSSHVHAEWRILAEKECK